MLSRLFPTRTMLALVGAVSLFAFSAVAIPSTFLASPAQAATVTSGTCTTTVDDATGVTMSVASNGDCVLSFTSVGTRTWSAPVSTVQYLIVGGGGGGSGGGGGAGGVLYNSSSSITPGNSYAVVVGGGGNGSAASASGSDGSNSSFNSIVASGGGGGGARQAGGRAGASSGGAGQDSATAPGASSQGFAGATGPSTAAATGAGGGGGAGSVGIRGFLYSEYPGAQRTPGGNGGNGLQYSISGSATYYGGGGGGGPNNNSSATVEFGRGGNGGGGNGANDDRVSGTAGQANTGGGGGGGDWEASGANGGSGIVVIRYSIPACIPITATSGADTVVSFRTVGICSWTVPSGVSSVQYLVVAGGGGGGGDAAGGGGAGGLLTNYGGTALTVTPSESLIVGVGGGGVAGHNGPSNDSGGHIKPTIGGHSQFGSIVSFGGGFGGNYNSGNGGNGGSGGGGAYNNGTAGSGTAGQGNAGGNSAGGGSGPAGGGGGGAGGVGTAGNTAQGQGGPGTSVAITGSAVTYAGGGGGGRWSVNASAPGANNGGSGGGGAGSIGCGNRATDAVANTGGGGGGAPAGCYGDGGSGGSGIVIVRYTTPVAPTNSVAPAISGTTQTGSTLSTTNGTWTGSPSLYAYQWKRAATSGGSYSDISSATNSTYVLTDDDINKYIKVSVIATNGVGPSSTVTSAASTVVTDLPDSIVPTATTPVSTATGFTFTISNYSPSYTYALTTTKGTVSRSTDDVTVTGLTAGESATVTIAVSRTNYKSGTKTVTSSATPATTTTTTVKPSVTTTTAAPALSIVIQAPVTTVAQGQVSVATLAPTTTTTTIVVLGANGVPVPTTTTTTVAPARSITVVTTTTVPAIVTTTTVGPPVVAKVDAGQTAVQVDGIDTDATVSRENNQMVVTAGSLSATLSGIDKTGKTSPLDSDGTVHLSGGDIIKISVGGFKTGSLVEVWLFSTPTKLGSAVVSADGTMSGTYKLPFGIKSGSHRVVVTAKLPNGKSTTFTLGILVGDISTTSTLTRVLIAIPITLAVGFGFLLPTQLRRRRKSRIT